MVKNVHKNQNNFFIQTHTKKATLQIKPFKAYINMYIKQHQNIFRRKNAVFQINNLINAVW